MLRHKTQILLLFIILTSALSFSACRAGAASRLTEQQWRELTQDKAFGYRDTKEIRAVKTNNPSQNIFSRVIGPVIAFFATPAGRIIIWTLLFLFIGLAFLKILLSERPQLFGRSKKAVVEDTQAADLPSEDLLSTDWEEHLTRATRSGNMKLAVRYSFMLLLQLMQEKQMIHYRADKTNYDYYHELDNSQVRQPFRQLTRQYEYTWYGNYPLHPSAYETYMDTFNALKTLLYRS